MKEIIVLILVLVSLFSCSKSDVVQVSGRIENGDSIVSILVDDSIYTLSLDQQGFFSGKIDMVKGGYATMLHNALNLYLSPGEDLEIYVNAKNFSGSLYFRGSLGGINSYLKEQEIAVFFDKDYYALNEEEFVQKMRALIDEKVKLLEAKNFDDSFTELEKQRIGYSIAVRASLYPSFRRNMYPDEDYRPGSVFSDFLSSFSINNERLIGAKDYRDFLLNYVYIQGSRGAQGWENYSDGIADYILATVNSPTIKSFLLTQLVYNYICENNGIEGADYLLSVFHQECTDPNKIAYIDGMVELWEKILPGHDAPDFALRDTEGKTACTYGALGAFSTGVGSTDMGAAMAAGETWFFKVPAAIRVHLTGKLRPYVSGKDVILTLIGMIGVDGNLYQSLEFTGPGVTELTIYDRLTICNLAIEAGAKNGIFPVDDITRAYVEGRVNRPWTAFEARCCEEVHWVVS